MNKRLEALERGNATYTTGKPCRRGHLSDRYTSNGSCIACLNIQNEATKNIAKVAKGRRNLALAGGLRERIVMVRDSHVPFLNQITELLQYATLPQLEELKLTVERLYEICPSPRSLNRDDLIKFMDYRDGQVQNLAQLEIIDSIDDDPFVYVMHNGHRYRGQEMMEVLKGTRLNVIPK